MSATQAFEIIAIVAIAVAAAAGAGLGLVYVRLQRYQRNQHVIMGSRGTVDIVEHVTSLDDKLNNIRTVVEDLTLAARDHEVRIDNCLSRVGIVRFDAYQDLGGRQSTAVAFLNAVEDGVIITTVVSRDFARMYVKLIRDGKADIPLAPEEVQALDQARSRGNAPFTIRPRVEGKDANIPLSEDDVAAGLGLPLMGGIPGPRPSDDRVLDRENRSRKRRGLPLLDELPVPSALGWTDPHTPAPEPLGEPRGEKGARSGRNMMGRSLAERHPVERRPDTSRSAADEDGREDEL